jgi:3-oxoadipate enol-lactonase
MRAAIRDRPARSRELPRLRCPTLCLAGEHDAITPPDELRAAARAIPGARFSAIPGAGHLPCLEAPAAFDAALLAFLDDCYAA